jgi:peptidoglycan/LPS O-acetylase OafA/YrhL
LKIERPAGHYARSISSAESPTYRPEIDGLRALAVIPVILFHAGLAGFSGGFVGVDVFFVISGYLITSLIDHQQRNGTFSICSFYERRARRILPALLVVMMACVPFALYYMSPNQLTEFGESVLAVSGFISNVFFWRETGYFSTSSELKPLLHTWSLGVEEQFYLFFPLALIGLSLALRRKGILIGLSIAAIGSILLSTYASYHAPAANFYLAPTRIWELLLGALLAMSGISVARKRFADVLGFFGLALIILSVCHYDRSTKFPGIAALAPTLGTVLLIGFADHRTVLGRLLAAKPLAGIGLISYSAYLWHYPLFAFARIRDYGEIGTAEKLLLASVALVLAFLTWRYIERPFRNRQALPTRMLVGCLVPCAAIVAGFGALAVMRDGLPARFDIPAQIAKTLAHQQRPFSECSDRPTGNLGREPGCAIGSEHGAITTVLFGDSHSLALVPVVHEALQKRGARALFTGSLGCLPFLGVVSLRSDQPLKDCAALNERVYAFVKEHRIRSIMLVARWTYYTDGGYEGEDFSYVGLSDLDERSPEQSRKAFLKGLETTLVRYAAIGTRVTFVHQIPQQRFEPDLIYGRAYRDFGEGAFEFIKRMSVPRKVHEELQRFVRTAFATARKTYEFQEILLDDVFCDEASCAMGDEQGSWYSDNDHLSRHGADVLIRLGISQTIDDCFTGPDRLCRLHSTNPRTTRRE